MNQQSDLDYYTARAAVERELSDSAPDPGIALIHTQLADRYEALAAGLTRPLPYLRVAGGADTLHRA
jgi:hypothetical protein